MKKSDIKANDEDIKEKVSIIDDEITEDDGLSRARNYFILLYKDTTSYNYNEALRVLKGFKYWAYMEHKPEEDEKKEHTHFFLHLDNAMSIKRLSSQTGIPVRFFKVPRSIRSVNRYLIHKDDEEKIQYNINDVNVSKNWQRNFNKCFDDLETEEEIIIKIFKYIDDLRTYQDNYPLMLKSIMLWAYQNTYDSVYRRYKKEFDEYIRSVL